MDQRTRAIIIGVGALFILAVVSLIVFFALRLLPANQSAQRPGSGSLSSLPTISLAPSPSSVPTISNTKSFIGQGFSLDYPANWGILTCGNSSNVEFDPLGNGDLKNVACDSASKPITVLVANRLNCTGETIKIGEKQVVKSKTVSGGSDINYRWCIPLGNTGLDITHRVSQSGSRATSKEDFSSQIEQIIKTINTTPRAS